MNGHLFQRGKSWVLVVRIPDPLTGRNKQKWITLEAKEEKEAIKEQRKILVAIDEGKYKEPSHQTVGEWLFFWLEELCGPKVKAGKMSANTFKSYDETVRLHLEPELGDILLTKLTPGRIDKYYAKKLSDFSATSVNYHARVLHAALQQAWVHEEISENPCNKVRPPGKADFEAELPGDDWLWKVLDKFTGTPYYLPTILALTTGMRRGEVLGLTWDNVFLDQDKIIVRKALKESKGGGISFGPTKGKRSRQVPLTEAAKTELKAARIERDLNIKFHGDKLYKEWNTVCCWPDGSPIKPGTLTQRWRTAKQYLGVDSRSRFHDLRHNYGTLLIEGGADVNITAANMGHAQIATTQGYIKARMDAQKNAVKTLDDRVFGHANKVERPKLRYIVKNVSRNVSKAHK